VGFRGEFDVSEEVSPCPMNPRFGEEATGFESIWLVMKEVDDEVEYL
jgi:hypothetical protein